MLGLNSTSVEYVVLSLYASPMRDNVVVVVLFKSGVVIVASLL